MLDTMRNRVEFAALLAGLNTAFLAAKPLDEAAGLAYWSGLCDLELPDLQQAASRAIRECRFFPSVSELRYLAGNHTAEQRAAMAWSAVRRADRLFRSRSLFIFDDPVCTATVLNLGGPRRFLEAKFDEREAWLRKDFERVYVLLHGSGVQPSEPISGEGRVAALWANSQQVQLDDVVRVARTRLPWAIDDSLIESSFLRTTRLAPPSHAAANA